MTGGAAGFSGSLPTRPPESFAAKARLRSASSACFFASAAGSTPGPAVAARAFCSIALCAAATAAFEVPIASVALRFCSSVAR